MRVWVELSQGRILSHGMFKIARNKGADTRMSGREAFLQLSAGTSSNHRLLESIGSPMNAMAPDH